MILNKNWLQTLSTLIILLGMTTVIFLYTSGFRLQKDEAQKIDLTKTGMISAKSIPEGASIYLDNKIISATNDTISGVTPGKHTLRIVKKGFEEWTKEIEVFDELVTDITAVLVSQSPMLEPLTNTGAKNPNVSYTLTKLAYFSKDTAAPGVWVMPINQGGLNLFRANPTVVLQDTKVTKYSDGKSIIWSPDETKLLVETGEKTYYLVDLKTNSAQTMTNYEQVLTQWNTELKKKREDFITKLDMPQNMKSVAISDNAMWSPDEKKFLYTVTLGDKVIYKVNNMEKPLPVGEKVDTTVFETTTKDKQPIISWFSDSYHLLVTEGNVDQDNRGRISLIRIDGTNKAEIYSESLYSPKVYSVPGGDKIIILTSFKSGGQTDLYTIGLR